MLPATIVTASFLVCVGGSMPVNVPYSQSMRRSASHNYNTPRYLGPSSPKIDLLPADSKASDSQDMQGEFAGLEGKHVAFLILNCTHQPLLHDITVGASFGTANAGFLYSACQRSDVVAC